MSATVNFLIRDGVANDIPACLLLDTSYETENVWQMQISDQDGWRVDFKTERLPRAVEMTSPVSEARLRAALPPDQCFLIATTSEDQPEIIGFLAMRADAIYQFGLVQELVVARTYRRHQIATRLSKIAIRWAKEHHLTSVMVETQTKNYPAIRCCEAAGFAFCGFNDRYFPSRDIAVYFSQSVR